MSMESATKFYETMEKDTELQKQISTLKSKEETENLVKKVLGYDFSQEEMQKIIFEKKPELTDEELEAVIGGSNVINVMDMSDVINQVVDARFIVVAVAAS